MSTTELGRYESPTASGRSITGEQYGALDTLRLLLAPLASLRLTVVLLGLSLFLVLAGTLAQVDRDVWYVVHSYFRTWLAWIEVRIFFPRTWGVSEAIRFPFPGGKAIGVALALNLVAAHAVRFKVASHGKRLWLGWATIALGAAITWAVIASGANTAVESQLSPQFANMLWHLIRAALGGAVLTLAYVLALTRVNARQSAAMWLWWFGVVAAALLAGLAVYLFANPDARLNASGLRILWQLAKAGGASVVLGLGCWAVFAKRAGIVLLHGGIGLLMFSELYTASRGVEAQMSIREGQTAMWAQDIRSVELAFTNASGKDADRVTVIPGRLLQEAAAAGTPIEHDDLPFAVRVVKYLSNSSRRLVQPGEETLATAGIGQLWSLQDLRPVNGVETEQQVDVPGAYVELLAKDGKSQGTYLAWPFSSGEALTADGKPWEMSLRFKRIPKPYRVTLEKFKFDRYVGTETAKNYESVVRFADPANNVDFNYRIFMNNPLRYAGDTLYQADFDKRTEKTTVLQVVTNTGWMVPYVACMIVLAGMLVHFLQGLIRFLYRREDEARRLALERAGSSPTPASTSSSTPAAGSLLSSWRRPAVWVPALIVALLAGYTFSKARPPRESLADMKIHQFGELPVVYNGRTQPIDSLASNTLRLISRRATYEDSRYKQRQPAIRWLLDVVSRSPAMWDHRVVRIENLDVVEALGLKRREGFCYSLAELRDHGAELERQVKLARETPEAKRNLTQAKFLELDQKVKLVLVLMEAFDTADLSGDTKDQIIASYRQLLGRIAALQDVSAPRPVPPDEPDGTWETLLAADKDAMMAEINPAAEPKVKANEAAPALRAIFAAYAQGDVAKFNGRLADYQKIVSARAAAEQQFETDMVEAGHESPRKPAERLNLDRIRFEEYFNQFDPFVICLALYITAFVLAAAAWLGWSEGFNRAANWLLWFTFAVHTFGLVCRIYISGRPPVTNLYSSAIFIGWAAVLFALLFEVIYRLGIGNLIAAAMGIPTMIIAYYLTFEFANSGDTLGVMQAVLDTNFWLGTHVVCISLGYTTTLLAGFLGMTTILMGLVANRLDDNQRRQLTRMTYGTICFAIFFSFIGTVLGGLWADDSWGRFWGWDPKENGALMIVLWNAIVLHARWGKMIGERGLASLAVLGNVVVAWSWWGVNQLGVGLHSYGKAQGITEALTVFDVLMIAVVITAYVASLKSPTSRVPTATGA
jgi:ABC-type transport system involved in cytochrome c biogenesis permease subunit